MVTMYELGYTINGVRYVVYSKSEFPPYPVHDVVYASVRAFKAADPTLRIQMFQEHDGQAYSC